jgi:hypothetical protein
MASGNSSDMSEQEEAQVKAAAQIHANIHFAEQALSRQHESLETALKGFNGEQATLYATMTMAQEAHWQKLAEQKTS